MILSEPLVQVLKWLRVLAVSASATAVGVITMAAGRGGSGDVELKVGDVAPDFELPGSDSRTYRLRELLDVGRTVVIAWFPKAFTGGCTAQCASIGASGDDLRRFNMRYFAASVDTPETNARFAQSLGIDYPILSDAGKTVARAYGVLSASGYASRWTFYIGGDGRILTIDKKVRPSMHGRDIVAQLTERDM
jgi:peroxiredoxin Q/BCP